MKKQIKNHKLSILTLALTLVFLLVISVSAEDWAEPTCSPAAAAADPASCNMSAPLNTSSDAQTKNGDLDIEGDLHVGYDLNVDDDVIATNMNASTGVYTPLLRSLSGILTLSSSSGIVFLGGGSGADIRSIGKFSAQTGLIIPNKTTATGTLSNGSLINDSGILKLYNASSWHDILMGPETWIDDTGGDEIYVSDPSIDGLSIYNETSAGMGLTIFQDDSPEPGLKIEALSVDPTAVGLKIDTSGGVGLSVDSAGTHAVHACNDGENCVDLGTEDYSAVFTEPTVTNGEIYAEQFINTSPEYSPINQFTNSLAWETQKLAYYDGGGYIYQNISSMVWDGEYLYIAGNSVDFSVLKVRTGTEPEIVHAYKPTAFSGFIPLDIVSVKDKLVLVDDHTYSAYLSWPDQCTISILNKNDFFEASTSVFGTDCDYLTTDGEFAIMPFRNGGAVDRIYFIDADNAATNYIDVGALGCYSPQKAVYDGENLWVTCDGGATGGDILKLNYDCNYTSPTVNCTVNSSTLYPDRQDPNLIFFDGSYLWVSYNNPTISPLLKLDPNNTNASGQLEEMLSFSGVLNPGINSIDYDGNYIWATNPSVNQVDVISVYDGKVETIITDNGTDIDVPLMLAFDGNNIWNAYLDADTSIPGHHGLRKYNTYGNSGTTNGQRHFRGIIMSDDYMNTLVCAYMHYSSTTPHYTWKVVDFATDPTTFGYYCGY